MSTYVISGAASGIGAATSEHLRADGHRVIGVDLRGCDVEADLSTPAGRTEAVRRVRDLAPEGVHGVVP
ncbi:MAG: SDR family oxidoreductase, partial [Nocardioides sp.]